MLCRNCRTEIADKALICFRCGAATAEATFKPAARRRGWSAVSLVTGGLALALLVLLAVYLTRTPPGEPSRVLAWVAVAIAVVIVAIRAYVRRRR